MTENKMNYKIKANNESEFNILAAFFRREGFKTRHMEEYKKSNSDYLNYYWSPDEDEISGKPQGDYDSLADFFDGKKGFKILTFHLEGVPIKVEKDKVLIDSYRFSYGSIRKLSAALPDGDYSKP